MKPTVKLSGEDGNVFAIIGRVSESLKRAGMKNEAEEFRKKALSSKSYDEILTLVCEYAEID